MKLLNVRIDSLDKAALMTEIDRILAGKSFQHLATVNPEFLVEAHKNIDFEKCLNHCKLNICDGFGITLWTKILYKKNIPRTPGVEVAEMIVAQAAKNGQSVYLLGGFGVTTAAVAYLQDKFPTLKIAGHQDGHPDELPSDVVAAQPDVILVAFGAPKQEFWLAKYGSQIPNLKLGVGIGGTFDFWAGHVKRAPKLFQTLGLEWCWRLIQEPRKRGKRIWTAVVTFSVLVLREKLATRD